MLARLVKAISGLRNVGDMFKFSKKDGLIHVKCNYGFGIMDEEAFSQHFEVVHNEWSEWENVKVAIDKFTLVDCKFSHNGKKVKLVYDGMTTKASCSPSDEFDVNKGLGICVARMKVRIARRELDQVLKVV